MTFDRYELITLFLTDSPRLVTELRRSVEQRRAGEIATAAQLNVAVAEAGGSALTMGWTGWQ